MRLSLSYNSSPGFDRLTQLTRDSFFLIDIFLILSFNIGLIRNDAS